MGEVKHLIPRGKDISTMYTRNENKKNGRKGYVFSKHEKVDVISPSKYGAFLQTKGRKR